MGSPNGSSGSVHDQFAADYDQLVSAYGWWGHEALFGLCFEYIRAGERLLDVGIGSGLASALFARAGLQVSGFDSSSPMLELCRAKAIAVDLRRHDVTTRPWPYPAASFDHVMICGVLHFVADLEPVFAEVARVLEMGGICAFTTKVPPPGTQELHQETIQGVQVVSHDRSLVEDVIAHHGFIAHKWLRLAAVSGDELPDTYYACAAQQRG